jgi:hypothetical protein
LPKISIEKSIEKNAILRAKTQKNTFGSTDSSFLWDYSNLSGLVLAILLDLQ